MKNKNTLIAIAAAAILVLGVFLGLWIKKLNTLDLDVSLILAVGIPTFVWLIVVVLYLWVLTKKFLLGDSGSNNPYKTETMGLPRGTIRGVLTLTLLFVVIVLQLYLIKHGTIEKVNTLMSAFELMLAFYFGSKVMHHLAATDKYKTEAVATANKVSNKVVDADFDDPEAQG